MVTLKDIAERVGVSITTVSRVLNGKGSISQETKDKVFQVMRELNYYPNEMARSLVSKNSHIIGLIVPYIDHPFFSALTAAIEEASSHAGYKLFLCISGGNQERELEQFAALQANNVAGVLVCTRDSHNMDELLNRRNIPVWVMEPLRGGRLARLSEAESAPLKEMRPEEPVPAWAFRFLQSIPSVTMVLSGMSDLEQMKANIATFQTEAPLNEKEMAGLMEVAGGMVSQTALPCTACHYCVSHCPKGLNIPELLALYNEHSFTGGGFLAPMALSAIPQDKWPSACIGCRSCEKVCPQQLKISEAMADFTAKLGG